MSVSVLYREPKLLKEYIVDHCPLHLFPVSVLYREPKLLKVPAAIAPDDLHKSFSALP